METVIFGNIKIRFRSSSKTEFYCEWIIDNFTALKYDVSIQSADFYLLPKLDCFLELQRPFWSKITLNLINRNFVDSEICYEISVSQNRVKLFYNNSATIHFSKTNQKADLLEDFKLPVLGNESLIIACSIKLAGSKSVSTPIQKTAMGHGIQFESLQQKTSLGHDVQLESLQQKTAMGHDIQLESLQQKTAMDNDIQLESLQQLSNDFSKIFDQSSYTDFTLCVEGEDIKVHKTILRARSPVFDKMLQHITGDLVDLADSIDIVDVRLVAMKRFMTYLYTGTYGKASFDETSELYYAADKYEVLNLRDSCKKDLLTLLQVDNACSLMKLANHHSDDSLRDEVMKFMQINFKSIVETESWEELVNNDTKLAASVMRFCARALSA